MTRTRSGPGAGSEARKRTTFDLVLFLTSDAGAKISGQALPVDEHTEGPSSGADRSSDPSGE